MQQFHRVRSESEAPAISFLVALKGLQINRPLINYTLKEYMKYRDWMSQSLPSRSLPRALQFIEISFAAAAQLSPR